MSYEEAYVCTCPVCSEELPHIKVPETYVCPMCGSRFTMHTDELCDGVIYCTNEIKEDSK